MPNYERLCKDPLLNSFPRYRIADNLPTVDDLEAEQETHDMRMDALGIGLKSANDDIAALAEVRADE